MARTNTFLGERYGRLARRRGKKRATITVGNSVLTIVWRLLSDPDGRYWGLGADYHESRSTTSAFKAVQRELTPPSFDPLGYWESIEHCREKFPSRRILSGMEMGEPHLHAEALAKILASGPFDRVLGSLHCLPDRGGYAEPPGLFGHW